MPCVQGEASPEEGIPTTASRGGKSYRLLAAVMTLFAASVALLAWCWMPGHATSALPKEYEVISFYSWKDSNRAVFGSDTERMVKKESAESEPAWRGAGQEVGLQVWRINKFKVEAWDKDMYGEFYNGDSYIVLNTYKKDGATGLKYDVHFWIGKYSTQDEYGTAAYKTVELDTFLDDKPVQHREVQGHESSLFKSYFSQMKLLQGGVDTGFKRVLPAEYTPKLLEVKTSGVKVITTELPFKRGNLNSDSAFIIDTGAVVYQYNGAHCSHKEKFKAARLVKTMKQERGKIKTKVLEEASTPYDHPALMLLKSSKRNGEKWIPGEKEMFKVSDADGSLDFDEVASGADVSKDKLTPDEVYIINTGEQIFVWIGSGASTPEKRNSMAYAAKYLNETPTPFLPISVVQQGRETDSFKKAF